MWVKLLESMPKFKTVDPGEVEQFATSILVNHRKDLKRYHILRQNKVSIDEMTPEGMEECMRGGLIGLLGVLPSIAALEQYENVSYNELANEVIKWGESHGGFAETFARELVNPSKETVSKWLSISEAQPLVYGRYDYIPPRTLARILGVPVQRVERTLKRLRTYLIESGFQPAYAQ